MFPLSSFLSSLPYLAPHIPVSFPMFLSLSTSLSSLFLCLPPLSHPFSIMYFCLLSGSQSVSHLSVSVSCWSVGLPPSQSVSLPRSLALLSSLFPCPCISPSPSCSLPPSLTLSLSYSIPRSLTLTLSLPPPLSHTLTLPFPSHQGQMKR